MSSSGQPRRERGAVTLWMLVLVLMLLTLGGLSVDLWQAVAQRRALVAVADAAAYAGASGLDVDEIRAGRGLVLDPSRARALANAAVRAQSDTSALTGWRVEPSPDQVTVVVTGEIDTLLLRLLAPDFEHLDVTVTATAEPRPG